MSLLGGLYIGGEPAGSGSNSAGLVSKNLIDQTGATNPFVFSITKQADGDIIILVTMGYEQAANGDGVQISSVLLDGVEQGPRLVFPVNTNTGGAVTVTPRATDVCLFMIHGLLPNVSKGAHTISITAAAAFDTHVTNFGWLVSLLYT